MTFCLGITVDDGLVGIADTRVLSGHQSVTAKKAASYQGPGFSFFVMTSGLRSLRDKVLLFFGEAFARNTNARDRLYKAVNLYAVQVRRVAEEDGPTLQASDCRAIPRTGCFSSTRKATGSRSGLIRPTRSSVMRTMARRFWSARLTEPIRFCTLSSSES